MDIKKLYKEKEKLEDKLSDIDAQICVRWEKLGHSTNFERWALKDNIVYVGFSYRDGEYGDHAIPIEFFEIEDTDEAIRAYKAYREKVEADKDRELEKTYKEERKKRYEELKKEFEK